MVYLFIALAAIGYFNFRMAQHKGKDICSKFGPIIRANMTIKK